MVKSKTSCLPESNKSKIPIDGNKGHASNPNKYRGNKPWNKPSQEPKYETNFQGQCTDLEGYIFDLGPRASNKFARTMKELNWYLGATYSDSLDPSIMDDTAATITDLEMPTITDLGTECPKTNGDMTYPDKNNIYEAIWKIWGRRMSTNQTCTRYIISLWSKQMNNYKKRRQ